MTKLKPAERDVIVDEMGTARPYEIAAVTAIALGSIAIALWMLPAAIVGWVGIAGASTPKTVALVAFSIFALWIAAFAVRFSVRVARGLLRAERSSRAGGVQEASR